MINGMKADGGTYRMNATIGSIIALLLRDMPKIMPTGNAIRMDKINPDTILNKLMPISLSKRPFLNRETIDSKTPFGVGRKKVGTSWSELISCQRARKTKTPERESVRNFSFSLEIVIIC
jgi:hypothetical protein